MLEQLGKNAIEINREKLVKMYDEANEMVDDLGLKLSWNEKKAIKEILNKKNVPLPKLQIKDHKKKMKNGKFDSRIIVPSNNPISGCSEVGYKSIKNLFKKNGVEFERLGIKQALEVKHDLENLNINKREHTIT